MKVLLGGKTGMRSYIRDPVVRRFRELLPH